MSDPTLMNADMINILPSVVGNVFNVLGLYEALVYPRLHAFSSILATPIIVSAIIRHVVNTRSSIGILLLREYPNHCLAPDWSGDLPVQP